MSDPQEDNFLAIGLSDSDDPSAGTETKAAVPKESRTGQSAAAFEAVKKAYAAKVEDGEIWRGISLPLKDPSKQEVQGLLHAVEELYFFRRYEEALGFLRRVLAEGGVQGLGEEARGALQGYERRCREKLGERSGSGAE